MTYYVYVLMNKNRTVNFTGVTNNLLRRIAEHKTSFNPESFTSRYNIFDLVYVEEYQDIRDAIAREKQLKGLSRQKKMAIIKELNPNLKNIQIH